jgi:hypothetical protein
MQINFWFFCTKFSEQIQSKYSKNLVDKKIFFDIISLSLKQTNSNVLFPAEFLNKFHQTINEELRVLYVRKTNVPGW